MTTKPTEVVVAVAFDKDGRFLMTSRPEGKVYAGYWEFAERFVQRCSRILMPACICISCIAV